MSNTLEDRLAEQAKEFGLLRPDASDLLRRAYELSVKHNVLFELTDKWEVSNLPVTINKLGSPNWPAIRYMRSESLQEIVGILEAIG